MKQAFSSSLIRWLGCWFVSLFLFGCGPSLSPHTAEQDGVLIRFSTNQVAVGDILTADVEVTHPAASAVTLSGVDRGDTLSVVSRQVETKQISDEESVTHFHYQLQPFELGVFPLTTNALSIRQDGNTESRALPDLTFEVSSQLGPNDIDLADLKEPVLWKPPTQYRFLLSLLLVLLLALIAGLIAYRWLRKGSIKSEPPPIIIPPHEQALQALRTLKSENLPAQGEFETYFVRLSDIVRHYLENRFDLHAPERTTEEFIREASESRALTSDQRERVQDFLVQSDLVKFARFTPSATEADMAYDSAIQLVNETTSQPAGEGE